MAEFVPDKHTIVIKILEFQREVTAEAGTNTTNITISAHDLLDDCFIVNTTRRATTQSSAERGCRKVTYVDDNNISIDTAIAGQTSGDTIRLYKWVDRTEYLKQKTFSLSKRAQGDSNCKFQFLVNYVE